MQVKTILHFPSKRAAWAAAAVCSLLLVVVAFFALRTPSLPEVPSPAADTVVAPLAVPSTSASSVAAVSNVTIRAAKANLAAKRVKPRATDSAAARSVVAEASWSALYAELIGPAKAGDKAAADKLFRATLRCARYLSLQARISSALASDVDPAASKVILNSYNNRLRKLQSELRSNQQQCASADEVKLRATSPSVLLTAAKAGNAMAASCYVDGGLFAVQLDKAEDSSLVSAYRQQAWSLVHQGIAQGQWRMVWLMIEAYSPNRPQQSMLRYLVEPDPKQLYSWMRLAAYRTAGSLSADAETSFAKRAEQYGLDVAETGAANAWAQDLYERHFASQPPSAAPPPEICSLAH